MIGRRTVLPGLDTVEIHVQRYHMKLERHLEAGHNLAVGHSGW